MHQAATTNSSSTTAPASEIVRTAEVAPPAEIGGYAVAGALTAGQSWLASAAGGRRVVLKALDDDSLWKGQLHPSIKDRLGRVRELAHSGVANLYGVERDGRLVYMVWEYVEGRTLDEWATSSACAPRDFLRLSREVVQAVETLHARGIIHGSIKGGNVIVTGGGRGVMLTHVSPWLYTEPEGDVGDVLEMLGGLLEARGEGSGALARMLADARERGLTLRQVAGKMVGLIESREPALESAADEGERRVVKAVRRRSLMSALGLAGVGCAAFGAVWAWGAARQARTVSPAVAPAGAFEPATRATSSPARLPGPSVLPTPMPGRGNLN